MHEIETKILEINEHLVLEKLEGLGATKVKDTRLTVDWYCTEEALKGNHPWYLRVRSTKDGKNEMTWKSLETFVGNTRQSISIESSAS